MAFRKATKHEAKLRLALIGPSGSGKTYSALAIATGLGGTVAVIDTERGSASKYADLFQFDVLEPESFHPNVYIEAIHEAEAAGYNVLIIDSLSHAWAGKDGALELVDREAKKKQSGSSFAAWREVTPLHNALVDAMIASRCHLIATMRAKTEYIQEQDERGKTRIRKVGLAPVQRDGLEYEFDVVGDLDLENNLIISKSRCPALSGQMYAKPSTNVSALLLDWLKGAPAPVEPQIPEPPQAPPPAPAPEPKVAKWSPAETNRWQAETRKLGLSKPEILHLLGDIEDKPSSLYAFTCDEALAKLSTGINSATEPEQESMPF